MTVTSPAATTAGAPTSPAAVGTARPVGAGGAVGSDGPARSAGAAASAGAVTSSRARKVLTVLVCVQLLLPTQIVLPGLGGIGTPAIVLGCGCVVWWLWSRVRRATSHPATSVVPVMLLFALGAAASYVSALSRPTNGDELTTATMTMIAVIGWTGPLLVAHDLLGSADDVRRLVRTICLIGAALAVFGLVQFITGEAWVDRLDDLGIPLNSQIDAAQSREGFTRPAGTSIHPIEYGAVLCLMLPLALNRAVGAEAHLTGRRRLTLWVPPLLIVGALSVSSSRSAVVGMVIGVLLVAATWSTAQRIMTAIGGVAIGVVVFLTVPGMAGSMLGLFSGISGDSGVTSRVDSYGLAFSYFSHNPVFGRGLGTFLPRYRIFDNQYLLTLVELGLAGVACMVLVSAVTIGVGVRARRVVADPVIRQNLGGTTTAVAVGAITLAFFDGFAFPMMPGLWFLMMGLTGCLARIGKDPTPEPASAQRPSA